MPAVLVNLTQCSRTHALQEGPPPPYPTGRRPPASPTEHVHYGVNLIGEPIGFRPRQSVSSIP